MYLGDMFETRIDIPSNADSSLFHLLRAFAQDRGLTIREMDLKGIPGAVHWHLNKDSWPGTLELTWNSQNNELVATMRSNRQGAWIEATILELVHVLTQHNRPPIEG